VAMDLLTFEQAIEQSPPKRYVLLGNGFSIALKPDIFSYSSLRAKADFAKIPYAQKLFELLGTSDFEAVIRALSSSSKLLKAYKEAPAPLLTQLEKDTAEIKNILVTAIGQNHPDRPFEVGAEQYAACRVFLSHFSHVYTLNYDILINSGGKVYH
jgi:hypothetical protein